MTMPYKLNWGKIHILTGNNNFSAGWRYRRIYEPKFKQFRSQIHCSFPKDKIEVIGRKVPGVGVFEVEIEGIKLLHSKRNGDGFVDSPDKLDRIIEKIQYQLIQQNEDDKRYDI